MGVGVGGGGSEGGSVDGSDDDIGEETQLR